ncbi:unnamed protein product [marine sediment metagenome]|uniref:Uncharacterized protein n=1 Tax=marine sediment metagenome TaxID=412755 RepID=X1IHL9_9ZZZZ
MLKVYCNLCGNKIECTGDPAVHQKVLKILVRTVEGIELQIRFEVKVQKPNHICADCAKEAVKAVLV